MAFDGFVISGLVRELNEKLIGGRIVKIAQPEKDEMLLTVKCSRELFKLLLSADASLPLVYLTQENKMSPMTAPNFCMLLRKHLNSARIVKIIQPEFERILDFEIEHLNDLGDACKKHLVVELMGKHSNIIFCDDNYVIIDSIKHISGLVSSVREVLPGRAYFIPKTQEKQNPLTTDFEEFKNLVLQKPVSIGKAIYSAYTGISPLLGNEICSRSDIDASLPTAALDEDLGIHLYKNFACLIDEAKDGRFQPNIIYENKNPVEFSTTRLSCYGNKESKDYESVSQLLEDYYSSKNVLTRIHQKSADLRRIISNALERARKKLDIQEKQLKDTEKRDKYKVYGELINTYGYGVKEGSKSFLAVDYYTNKEVTIPLDSSISVQENAKKYFDRYNKLKRTYEATSKFLQETKEEIEHLESISNALDIARKEEDLLELKEELVECGYMKRKHTAKKGARKQRLKSRPFHYVSSDGYDIYVGKNNYQNEELTFQFAAGSDWWFHAKGNAGSHVIVKSKGEELPDRTFEEAGKLAAFYSKAKGADKVEIDYTQKKNVKKPNGAKPGFVVYYTNYSLIITPDITGIKEITEEA